MALLGSPSSDKRPVFLNLSQIHLPVTALVSILHRVSGVGMILSLPVVTLIMYVCMLSPAVYASMIKILEYDLAKVFMLLVLSGTMYHILAGVRHIYQDFSGAHGLVAARVSAVGILLLWAAWIAICVWRLWFS